MIWSELLIAAGVAFLVSVLGTRLLIGVLSARQILDRPNERSSHTAPTPRGGGIAVTLAVLCGWLAAQYMSLGAIEAVLLVALFSTIGLAALSFLDDVKGLPASVRFTAHILAVAVAIRFGGFEHGLFSTWVPPVLDWLVTGFVWLWFINLFNFMDGIDGISGVESASIAVGIIGLCAFGIIDPAPAVLAVALAAAAVGFLVWNWSPARVFLGDTGSVPLGFLLGWVMLQAIQGQASGSGAWLAVILLPAYYLADATLTLARRMHKREKIWVAHRQHFYQQAVIRGHGHAAVCKAILLTNGLVLVVAVWLAPIEPMIALFVAGMLVVVLLAWMQRAELTPPDGDAELAPLDEDAGP